MTRRRTTSRTGRRAERSADRFLTRAGLRVIRRNYRCRHGEIDLIMRDGDVLVFVEVRYRAAGSLATAIASIDQDKQRKIVLTALHFLSGSPRMAHWPMRFDVLAIDGAGKGSGTLQWLRDAFRAD